MTKPSRLPLFLFLLLTLARQPQPVGAAEPPVSPPLPAGMTLTAPDIPPAITGILRAVHERLSQNLEPRNNAAVWLVHLYGDDAFEPELHDVNLEMLGISRMSPESPLFVSVVDFVESAEDVLAAQVPLVCGQVEEQLLWKAQTLWTPADAPRLAGYLAANEKALQALTIAASCPRYYAPLLAPEIPSRLMAASLVIERRLPFLARMLAARALLQAGQGKVSAALDDLRTCHQLASLLANGSPFDVSVAKAQVIDSIAFFAEKTLLESGQLNADQLAEFGRMYAALPPFPPAAQAVDIGERAIVQQEIELLQSDNDSQQGFFEGAEHKPGDKTDTKSLGRVKWELARQRADAVQNQIVAALATADRAEQRHLFEQLDQDYAAWNATVDEKTAKFSKELDDDLDAMSAWVGENIAMSLRPNYWQRRNAQDRVRVRRDLVRVGIALEAYQRQHSEFPETLNQIASTFPDGIPLDACTDQPFHYERQAANQAYLASWGNNQKNDAGEPYNDDVELKLR